MAPQADGNVRPLSIDTVTVDDEFWNSWLETNRETTIEHQYEQLETGGCLDNFRRVRDGVEGGFQGPMFIDSDAYKWLESASYVLASHDDPDLDRRVEEVVSLVGEAQAEDGYLHTYFQLVRPDKRWTNLNIMHELYCAGHLIEAAVAHHRATGRETLLDVARRFADHVDDHFGPDDNEGVPGHEGIELALVKLYRVTRDRRYLDLARFFVEGRGRDPSPLAAELERIDDIGGNQFELGGTGVPAVSRNHFLGDDGEYDGSYAQDHAPIREQTTVEGHAVRAMYYYTGATMLLEATDNDDPELFAALERLWTNMTTRRMYVTGGIGSEHEHEGFTEDYDLPNRTAYAETCAAVGSVFWNQALFELTGEARYPELIERTLYNGFLVGVSTDGTQFFYVNPLESRGDHHRKEWFYVACCPPNASRLLASLGKYLYGVSEDTLYVNQYVGSDARATVGDVTVDLSQESEFPWRGEAIVDLSADEPVTFELALRVPEWAERVSVRVDGDDHSGYIEDGYARVEREWRGDHRVELQFPMEVERLVAHPEVRNDAGRVALRRGPVVYAVEETDSPVPPHQLVLPGTDGVEAVRRPDLLGGVTTIEGEVTAIDDDWDDDLYRSADAEPTHRVDATAIPYYAWDNREPGEMRVWLRED